MWWIVPVALTCLAVGMAVWAGGARYSVKDVVGPISAILGIVAIICWIFAPVQYFGDRSVSWAVAEYYEAVILPNIVEETEDFVVVSNLEAGIWQAGDHNIYDYNAYLKTNRYWQDVAIIQTWVYPAPEHLKYVRIQGGNQ